MKQWYILHTKPKAEYQVALKLQQQAFEVYLPEFNDPKATQDRHKKPFFPCYLFLKVDFKSIKLSQIQWIPGLHRVLTYGDKPVSISNEVIDLIRCKLGEVKGKNDWLELTFAPGDRVRIATGPFRDMVALFEGPTTSNQRVRVLLNIFGHANRVEIDGFNLEKVSTNPKPARPLHPRRTRGRGRRIKQVVE